MGYENHKYCAMKIWSYMVFVCIDVFHILETEFEYTIGCIDVLHILETELK